MFAALLLCMATAPMMAQKSIDKLAEELEKRDDVAINSVTKRNPNTRKVTKIVKTFSLKDEKMSKRLIDAFEKDEEYAITAIKDMPKGRKNATMVNFTFIFIKDKNQKITYTLSVSSQGTTTLTIIMNSDSNDISYLKLDKSFMEGINERMKDLDKRMKDMKIVLPTVDEEDLEEVLKNVRAHRDALGCAVYEK